MNTEAVGSDLTEQWIMPGEAGYFAVGYDDFLGGTVPVWTARTTGSLAALGGVAARWVHEAIEVEGKRTVRIYYMTDDGRVAEGGDLEIVTMQTARVES